MRLLTFSFLRNFKRKLQNINVTKSLYCDSVPPQNEALERYIGSGEFLALDASWPEEHLDMKELLLYEMQVYPNFVSQCEEHQLMAQLEPYLKKMRYEFDHWDDAIQGFRETEWPMNDWQSNNHQVFVRVHAAAFSAAGSGIPLPYQHVLDLAAGGQIKPHVDSIRFCGEVIAGLSLLSTAVMMFTHSEKPELAFRVLLPRLSLYVMRGSVRYFYKHAVSGPMGAPFRNSFVNRSRRVSIITRSQPKPYDPRPKHHHS